MSDTPLTIADAAAALRDGSITSVELTKRLSAVADELDPMLGTYIDRYRDLALDAAQRADDELAAGHDRGPLHGIPLGIKDILACREGPTTAQSLVYDPEWFAGRDAPVVARLRDAGAVITGKVTTMEYAIGLPDPTKPYPIPRNPWNRERWTGGSSSGSGSGVAAGMFLGALGTDTAGSIRIPSANCGITGLMPTFGLVPKSGCYPLGVTLDHVGPMTRTARDCALMLDVMAGHHPSDPNSLPDVPAKDYTAALTGDVTGLRVGVERVHHLDKPRNDPVLAERFEAAVGELAAAGATVVDVTLPYYDEVVAIDMMSLQVEAFGYHRKHLIERWDDYGVATRTMVTLGALYTADDYAQAQRVRRVAMQALRGLFDEVDIVVSPTLAGGAVPVDGLSYGDLGGSIYTGYWNPVGNPVLSAPMGFTDDGLPLGLQIAGRPLEDDVVLRAGDTYQRRTDFHLRVPEVTR